MQRAVSYERVWPWALAIYVVNFAIIWMVSYVPVCVAQEGLPRVCTASRPLSQIGILSMIALAVAFPSAMTAIAAIRLGRKRLFLIYSCSLTVLAVFTGVLFLSDYFGPAENGCRVCDRVFLTQIVLNMAWIFVLFPGAFLVPYLWARHRSRSM